MQFQGIPQRPKNPLAGYMRQPKIYIRLPSNGKYWPEGSIDIPENREFPVYSMTAKDELLFKTPDALMNGQAIVDVIKSCMPNILDPWHCPMMDLDMILIAMRLATYGDKMPFKHVQPGTNEEQEYEIDLRLLLDQLTNNTWVEQVAINPDFIIYVRPLTYRHMTQTGIKTFETQRILSIVNDESIAEAEKIKLFSESFNSLTKVTVDLVAETIFQIQTPEGLVTDLHWIKEFINNADKDIFKTVQDHLNELKLHNDIKPLTFQSTPEQIALGAPETYEVPVNFNNSDFFA